MFNLTSSTPKTWQTVSRQADRVNGEQSVHTHAATNAHSVRELGGILRERREAMGASLAEVETATRIRQKYLAAFESDDWHLLPGEIVGRGFLRNYATYLGLDSTELVERRRAVADASTTSTLAGTSAGSPLPPERNVDYRPKDVALKDEQEAIQQRELSAGPFLRVVGVVALLLFAWWLVSSYGTQLASGFTATMNSVQTRVAPSEAIATATIGSVPLVENGNPLAATGDNAVATPQSADNTANPAVAPANGNNAPPATAGNGSQSPAVSAIDPTATPTQEAPRTILIPTNTPLPVQSVDAPASNTTESSAPEGGAVAAENTQPEAAPIVETPLVLPTDTPIPTAVPTEVPTEEPPTPAPPAVVAPACPDARSALTSPGVNQTLRGVVPITGSAIHEAFQYYKLEYAFGANATDGFVYFDGANSQVDGGTLGTFNSASLPNGAYTLQITVVDLSANYPPPCRVTVNIAN